MLFNVFYTNPKTMQLIFFSELQKVNHVDIKSLCREKQKYSSRDALPSELTWQVLDEGYLI